MAGQVAAVNRAGHERMQNACEEETKQEVGGHGVHQIEYFFHSVFIFYLMFLFLVQRYNIILATWLQNDNNM
nr:hypothetical protein Prevot99_2690 [uncultured Prevotella sp.]